MSDLGNLSQCIVDNDPEVRARARGLRRKALVASVCVEAVCLGAMLLWPLITPGVLPSGYIVTPVPPYHGGGGSHASHPTPIHHHESHPVPRPSTTQIIVNPRNMASHVQPPDTDASIVGEIGPGDTGPGTGPDGPGVPGGSEDGRSIVVPRPPEPVQPHRQKMSEGVMEGALIQRVKPDYPLIARQMHLSGTVRLRAIIATDGSVQNLEVLSGHPILVRAAKDAVRQWRYRPTLLSGVPVEVETYITVNFVLGDR
jgi:periplasmic protein TonB